MTFQEKIQRIREGRRRARKDQNAMALETLSRLEAARNDRQNRAAVATKKKKKKKG